MICRLVKTPSSLARKGVITTLICTAVNISFNDFGDLKRKSRKLCDKLFNKVLGTQKANPAFNFVDNEPIGSDYMIYNFHLIPSETSLQGYIGCRIITNGNIIRNIVLTLGKMHFGKTAASDISEASMENLYNSLKSVTVGKEPRGQKYVGNFVIYRILGQPSINVESWRLTVKGNVKRKMHFTYKDLMKMPSTRVVSDFHCVTGWSVRNVVWEGIPLKHFAELAVAMPTTKWVLISSIDGYTTVVPLNDFTSENALLALRINGSILQPEQGYPARVVIPHLYGWKGAKWVETFEFRENYVDGYWEALGYHVRGNVWLEERFQ